jgi:long-chain acyl-CoA synthetase
VGPGLMSRESTGSLAHLLAWRAAERPDFPLLYVEDEGPWTVGALAAAATDIAERLAVKPGERAVVRVGNDERFLPALVAVWLRGAAAVAVHPAAPADEVRRVAESMGPTAEIVPAGSTPVTGLPAVAVERVGHRATGAELDVPYVADQDEALILLTSGSSGLPKGVVLTHGSGWANLRGTASAFRRDTSPTPIPDEPKPPNLIANPVSHTAGVVRHLFALYVGRSIVLLRKFDARAAKAALDRHGIDNLTINPTMMRMLLDALQPGDDLGRVRYVSSGTAPLPAALREAFEERFGVPVLQAYGQTEAFGGIAIESVKDVLSGNRRPGSVGRALPGVELRIVDGEIWARTPSSTAGYVGDADASPVDAGGWLHTGDLGHLDDDGYLYVTGRLRSTIICGGFNIVPEEVEAALLRDRRVKDVSVVGIPDERLGQIPIALIETDDDPADILRDVALAPYKRPRRIIAVPALPRVPNGKVDQRAALAIAAGS